MQHIVCLPAGYSVGQKCILFSVVFTPPHTSHHVSVWFLSVISLLLTNTLSQMRSCLSILLDRLRGSQKEDERGPLSIQSSLVLGFYHLPFYRVRTSI
jgi:hypothetical protein